ncbi:MAG: hypothetical protein NVSMB6_31590 [Burkholderiaceae bacterium]
MTKLLPKLGMLSIGMSIVAATGLTTLTSTTRVWAAGVGTRPFVTTQGCADATPCLSVINSGTGVAIFGRANNNEASKV